MSNDLAGAISTWAAQENTCPLQLPQKPCSNAVAHAQPAFLHVKGNSMTHKGVQVVVFAIRAKPLGAKCDFAALGFMVQMEI